MSPVPANRAAWLRRILDKLKHCAGLAGCFLLGRGPWGTLGVALSGLAGAWVFYTLLGWFQEAPFRDLDHFASVSAGQLEHLRRQSRTFRQSGAVGTTSTREEASRRSQVLVLVGAADSDAYSVSGQQVFAMQEMLFRAAEGRDTPFRPGKNDPKSVSEEMLELYKKATREAAHPQDRALALAVAFSWCWEYLGILPLERLTAEAGEKPSVKGLPPALADIDPASLPETFRDRAREVLLALLDWADAWRTTTLPPVEELDRYEAGFRWVAELLASDQFVNAEALAGQPMQRSREARREKKSALANELYRRPPLLPPPDFDDRRFSVVLFLPPSGDRFLRLAVEVQPVPGQTAWFASYGAFTGPRGGAVRAEPRVFLERLGSAWTGLRPATVRLSERQIASNFWREVEALAKVFDKGFTAPEDRADVERFVETALVSRLGWPTARPGPFAEWPEYERLEEWTAWPRRINGGNWWGLVQFSTVAVFFSAVLLCFDRYRRGREQMNGIAPDGHLKGRPSLGAYVASYGKEGDMLWRRERPYEVFAFGGSAAKPEALAEALDRGSDRIRYALVTIPNLGFLGTVIGISTALLAMSRTTGTALERQSAIQDMATSLGIAFDTTFVALALNIGLLLLHLMVSQREDDWKTRLTVRARNEAGGNGAAPVHPVTARPAANHAAPRPERAQ